MMDKRNCTLLAMVIADELRHSGHLDELHYSLIIAAERFATIIDSHPDGGSASDVLRALFADVWHRIDREQRDKKDPRGARLATLLDIFGNELKDCRFMRLALLGRDAKKLAGALRERAE